MCDLGTPSTQPPSVSCTMAVQWCMAGLSQVATAPPSYLIYHQGCCRSMMYWPIILCCRTIPVFLLQTRSSRYGRHYGLAVDQVLPVCGHRCRMARRGSSTVPPVISWIQKNTESHFGTGYIKFPCSPFARCTKCRLLLCLPSLHGYRRCFSRSYLYATQKLNTEEKPHGWSH